MKELYIEEAISQIDKLEKDLQRVKSLLERSTGKYSFCERCLIYVFEKEGKCPRCGSNL